MSNMTNKQLQHAVESLGLGQPDIKTALEQAARAFEVENAKAVADPHAGMPTDAVSQAMLQAFAGLSAEQMQALEAERNLKMMTGGKSMQEIFESQFKP